MKLVELMIKTFRLSLVDVLRSGISVQSGSHPQILLAFSHTTPTPPFSLPPVMIIDPLETTVPHTCPSSFSFSYCGGYFHPSFR